MNFRMHHRTLIFLAALLVCTATVKAAGIVEFSRGLLAHVQNHWGGEAVSRLQAWQAEERDALKAHDSKQSELDADEMWRFNLFWNSVPYLSDYRHWGIEDYWATPVEALASDAADCEDYSVAKYFSLKELGVPLESLRITYVRALNINESHMVLAYYPTPDADPYILDNLTDKLLRASQRDDLEPVYSFNDEDLWAVGANGFKAKSSQIRLWSELLQKMEKERAM